MPEFDPAASARRVIETERDGLDLLAGSIGEAFVATVNRIAEMKGRVICAGVGKSGHVARKIAATMASTGTPAYYVHPTEASHGDLGMIGEQDAVLALSKSGETKELGDLIAYCRRFGVPLIAMTPTTSTVLQLVIGDALAVALLEARGFTADHFRTFHPGGALGAALASVADVMHAGDAVPLASQVAPMSEVLIEMTAKSFGCVGLLDDTGRLAGIITDGDLRRHMGNDLVDRPAHEVMTRNPKTGRSEALAADALREMTAGSLKITQLFIVDDAHKPVGILHLHDLLRVGLS
jgi:arabinose-5-phosphate isomerase